MRRTYPIAAAAALVLAACAEQPGSDLPFEPQAALQSQAPVYLVTFRDDVDVPTTTRELAQLHGLAVRHMREHAARGFSAVIPDARLRALQADDRIALIEADGPVSLVRPVEEAKPGGVGGGGGSVSQTTPWGITKVGGAGDGTGKTAWVIDTGIDLAHADLNTSRACHRNFVPYGRNDPKDGNGHGTHVAGTIGAKNNSIDVVGVAANAYVCAVRVLDNSGSGTWEGVVNGVNYVAGAGVAGEVANMSLGGAGANATLEKAVADAAQKGIKFAIAAGNSGANAANYTPARVNHANVYTISAIAQNNCLTTWSNYGSPVDYAAPGSGITSTKKGGGTVTYSGTSMAAPHVAGILLLGSVRTNGYACADPDGNPDPIASR